VDLQHPTYVSLTASAIARWRRPFSTPRATKIEAS
jgi:hypothetical protein